MGPATPRAVDFSSSCSLFWFVFGRWLDVLGKLFGIF